MFNKKEYHKQYREKNLERLKEYSKQYRKENREKIKIRDKKYYEKHPEKHRFIMEEILKRELKEEEQVHHIDMNRTNNNPENLYVYDSKPEHMKGHKSFIKLIIGLLKNNVIEFKNGIYNLKTK